MGRTVYELDLELLENIDPLHPVRKNVERGGPASLSKAGTRECGGRGSMGVAIVSAAVPKYERPPLFWFVGWKNGVDKLFAH